MHRTHLPLRTWFLAAYLLATHSNGMSALQLQPKLGLGSYKSAWLLLHKLRRAMIAPDRRPLRGVIEIDDQGRGNAPKAVIHSFIAANCFYLISVESHIRPRKTDNTP